MPKYYGRGGVEPLKPKTVRQIRRSRKSGVKLRVLAQRHRRSITTICRAASGIGWYARPEYASVTPKPLRQKSGLSAERLRLLLDYSPATGLFRWKNPTSNRVSLGDAAGCISKSTGYVIIGVDGERWAAHRLAWLFMHGAFPTSQVDHVNGDRADNRISNLRLASNSQNKMNAAAHKDARSKYTGVFWEKSRGKWRAQISSGGLRRHLGLYDSEVTAAAAYDLAAKDMHGEFARLNLAGGAP
jgi:hypothetical protein